MAETDEGGQGGGPLPRGERVKTLVLVGIGNVGAATAAYWGGRTAARPAAYTTDSVSLPVPLLALVVAAVLAIRTWQAVQLIVPPRRRRPLVVPTVLLVVLPALGGMGVTARQLEGGAITVLDAVRNALPTVALTLFILSVGWVVWAAATYAPDAP